MISPVQNRSAIKGCARHVNLLDFQMISPVQNRSAIKGCARHVRMDGNGLRSILVSFRCSPAKSIRSPGHSGRQQPLAREPLLSIYHSATYAMPKRMQQGTIARDELKATDSLKRERELMMSLRLGHGRDDVEMPLMCDVLDCRPSTSTRRSMVDGEGVLQGRSCAGPF